MQQFIVPLWLVVALTASGCSQLSPTGLVNGEAGSSSWETARLDFVVDREEAKRSLRESNRAERERMLRDDFARDELPPERDGRQEKIIKMVSKPRQIAPRQQNEVFTSQGGGNESRIGHPLNPKADSTPSASLVAHPLHPRDQLSQLAPRRNAQNGAADVIIQQLPPMVPAPLQRTQASMLVPKTDSATTPKHTGQNSFEPIQLVAYEQEIQEEESVNAKQDSAPPTAARPERDEFTDEDFFAAGWCQNKQCEDQCDCPKAQKIASEVDPKPPTVLPAQFQIEDGPRWELPGLNVGLKPLRNASGTPPLPALGLRSHQATQLPIPGDHSKSARDQGDQGIRTASANIEGGTADSVNNADFKVPDETPLTWRQHLNKAVENIQNQINSTSDFAEQQQLRGKLELIRLMPSHLDERQQQYMDALTELLQTTAGAQPLDVYEAGETLTQLRDAISYLETIAGMKVVNANFCSKVTGFGQFEVMEERVFEAGQTVLIYCEIENHTSQPKVIDGKQMSSTRLAGSCIVYDENQKVVQQEEFPVVEDLATQRRRDFYMHIPFVVGDLPPGKYRYQLMIDDVGGGKSASLEPSLEFEVR